VSGNPIRPPVTESAAEAKSAFGLDPRKRVVLITGGSQGSVALNEGVLDMVKGLVSGAMELPSDLHFLWVTGPRNLAGISRELKALGTPGWIQLRGYVKRMPLAMRSAKLAISRAGAMTTSELTAHGTPAVLVPLPSSAGDHQTQNARSLAAAGAAVHLPEAELDGPSLWTAVEGMLQDEDRLQQMAEAALERGRPQATREIAEAVASLLPRPRRVES
jgi:UDP-N-acetylglucosamine--N-acetylmuramyl-(pentapeptide) pyrophosphoryl-undecaprenol N-acetylglucosamine transferase